MSFAQCLIKILIFFLLQGYGHTHLKMYFKLKYKYITFLFYPPPNFFHSPSSQTVSIIIYYYYVQIDKCNLMNLSLLCVCDFGANNGRGPSPL